MISNEMDAVSSLYMIKLKLGSAGLKKILLSQQPFLFPNFHYCLKMLPKKRFGGEMCRDSQAIHLRTGAFLTTQNSGRLLHFHDFEFWFGLDSSFTKLIEVELHQINSDWEMLFQPSWLDLSFMWLS